jgi:hypothetical protein
VGAALGQVNTGNQGRVNRAAKSGGGESKLREMNEFGDFGPNYRFLMHPPARTDASGGVISDTSTPQTNNTHKNKHREYGRGVSGDRRREKWGMAGLGKERHIPQTWARRRSPAGGTMGRAEGGHPAFDQSLLVRGSRHLLGYKTAVCNERAMPWKLGLRNPQQVAYANRKRAPRHRAVGDVH